MKSLKNVLVFPTPLEIAILLSVGVIVVATLFTPSTFIENILVWGEGLWSLLAFMTQMGLILLGGFVLASSQAVQNFLRRVASLPQTTTQAYLLAFTLSSVLCWLNWGLGLVSAAFLTRAVAQNNSGLHYPKLVATSYAGFLFWHGGLSGSIPLLVNTPGNFSEKWMGGLIPLTDTVFSSLNVTLLFFLFFSFVAFIIFSVKNEKASPLSMPVLLESSKEQNHLQSVSLFSSFTRYLIIFLSAVYLLMSIYKGQLQLNLNQLNLILFTLGLCFYPSLNSYMSQVKRGMQTLADIFIQYPLYGGIMAVMTQSGLVAKISTAFVAVSTETTYPLYMFLSAGMVNLLVPSGGGQWAVQASVVVEGAKQLSVPLPKVVLAVSWGDAWTNMAQPFWTLPLLAIAGLSLKDIIGYCLQYLVLSGLVIGSCFLMF